MTAPVVADSRQRRAARSGFVTLRVPGRDLSARFETRALVVTLVLTAVTAVVFAWSLSVGDFPIPFGDVVRTLVGGGTTDSDFIIRTLRLPRGLTGLFVGAGFGLAGAIIQRIARNPLASPDIIGTNAGAAAAALFVIVVLNGTTAQVTGGALAGALGASLSVYLLAYKRGVTGYRFVLVGIGITFMLEAVVSYLLTRGRIEDVHEATAWLNGSLNGRGWDDVRPMGWALLVLGPAALLLARQLRMLELGDDMAKGLGLRVERARGALLLVAVVLAAVATASGGPIRFAALVAPQIARRLVGERSVALVPSAVCGALLVTASDLVGRRLFAPTELPVGVVTAVVGAPFLLWLLARANRIGSAG
ncbi:MAG TPA: iron chelate uptake ABC transporter family permease subunit [Acidimicrobiales bacterium]